MSPDQKGDVAGVEPPKRTPPSTAVHVLSKLNVEMAMSQRDDARIAPATEDAPSGSPSGEAPSLFKRFDAARYLGMSVSWLAKAAVYGGGPRFHKIGRSVRYRRQDLDDFLEIKVRRSTSDVGVRE